MTVEEVIARAEIGDVVARLARGMDRNDRALILGAYHPGAIDHHGEFDGPPDAFADWIAMLHRERARRMVHLIAHHLITVSGPDVACGEATVWSVLRSRDPEPVDLVGAGRYLDRYERLDGQWGIAERTVVVDWFRTDPVPPRSGTLVTIDRGGGSTAQADPSYALLGW